MKDVKGIKVKSKFAAAADDSDSEMSDASSQSERPVSQGDCKPKTAALKVD